MATATAERPVYTFSSTMGEAELGAELKRVQSDFASGIITFDDVAEMLDEYTKANTLRIRAEEQAKAAANARGAFTLKVSEKGALSVYGLQRMPVTLYIEQWLRLIPYLAGDDFVAFVKANNAKFARKSPAGGAAA